MVDLQCLWENEGEFIEKCDLYVAIKTSSLAMKDLIKYSEDYSCRIASFRSLSSLPLRLHAGDP